MNEKGFTLIEVLISLVVLSIVIIPFTEIFMTSTKVDNISKRDIKATYLAQNYMEMAKYNYGETFDGGEIEDNIVRKTYYEDGFEIELISEAMTTKGGESIYEDIPNILEQDFDMKIYKDDEFEYFEIGQNKYSEGLYYYQELNPNNIEIDIVKHEDDGSYYIISPISNDIRFTTFNNDDTIVFKLIIEDEDINDINLSINNKSDRKVIVYEYDDFQDKVELSIDGGANTEEVEVFSNLITAPDKGDYSEIIYRITVNVSYNERTIQKIVSMLRR